MTIRRPPKRPGSGLKKDISFENLLKPYAQGGTKTSPVKRSMGTIVEYLVNKKGYPIDVAGAAIFYVLFWLSAGNKFKGDGSYGSKGKELVTAMRLKCDELLKEKLTGVNHQMFVEQFAAQLAQIIMKDVIDHLVSPNKRKFLSWWRGKDVFAQWD